MRKITYKTLTIRNFLSVGNEEIVIDFQSGLNLITGKNIDNPERKNAVGKSVLIDAFYYALFGKTIREIKKEFIVNNVTKGKGNISLTFDVQGIDGSHSYEIRRQVKPSKVELWKGDEDVTNDSIDNTNKAICNLIGSNSIICKSCDILSLSDNVPFMAKTAAEKRKFIEDIFALEIFGKMFKDLKDLIKENKNEMSISSTRIEEIQKFKQILVKQKEEFEKKIEERDEKLKLRKAEIEKNYNETKQRHDSIVIGDISVIEENLKKLSKAQYDKTTEIVVIRDKITTLRNQKRTDENYLKSLELGNMAKCDKCHQQIPHDHKDFLNKEKESYNKLILETEELLNSHNITLKELEEKSSKITQAVESQTKKKNLIISETNQKESLKVLCETLKLSLDNLDSDSKESDESVQSFLDNLKTNDERYEEESSKFSDLKLHNDDLETCKFILGEEGVKAYAVKKLLGMLNSSIQKYITDLGMTMKCKFDEYFEEHITNDKGKDISYWYFSGGERKTVDIACAWSFKDIKRKLSGVSSNLEFNDEIFDSAFDERGMDLLIEVLKNRIDAHKLSVYAISHRKETLKHIDGEIVMLEKENGITTRKLNHEC